MGYYNHFNDYIILEQCSKSQKSLSRGFSRTFNHCLKVLGIPHFIKWFQFYNLLNRWLHIGILKTLQYYNNI